MISKKILKVEERVHPNIAHAMRYNPWDKPSAVLAFARSEGLCFWRDGQELYIVIRDDTAVSLAETQLFDIFGFGQLSPA